MERNYPKSFITLWEKLNRNWKASKVKNGFKYEFELNDGEIDITLDGEKMNSVPYDEEIFYCELLDYHLVPRVKEY